MQQRHGALHYSLVSLDPTNSNGLYQNKQYRQSQIFQSPYTCPFCLDLNSSDCDCDVGMLLLMLMNTYIIVSTLN